jgi:hypothetical protein
MEMYLAPEQPAGSEDVHTDYIATHLVNQLRDELEDTRAELNLLRDKVGDTRAELNLLRDKVDDIRPGADVMQKNFELVVYVFLAFMILTIATCKFDYRPSD